MAGAGLSLNLEKTALVGINIEKEVLLQQAAVFGCRAESLPIKYLGVQLGGNYKKSSFWNHIVEKFRAKLENWRNLLLSKGGRLTLALSIFNSIPLYAFSVFKAQKRVISIMEQIVRNFFWNGNGCHPPRHLCEMG